MFKKKNKNKNKNNNGDKTTTAATTTTAAAAAEAAAATTTITTPAITKPGSLNKQIAILFAVCWCMFSHAAMLLELAKLDANVPP